MGENKKGLTVREIADVIEEAVPVELQEEWDNSGILIGFEKTNVQRILLCLEINRAVLDEAKQLGAEMIITHHPVIFSGFHALRDSSPKDRLIMDIIKSGISVYSCHTPFDKVKGGNNDVIVERLGLTAVRTLSGGDVKSPSKMQEKRDAGDIGRIGEFKNMITFGELIQHVAIQLDLSIRQIRAAGSLDKYIAVVGVCTGAGADMMKMAVASGCDLMITGDVKYHEAQEARELGICLLDAGHYGTEKFFAEAMKNKLEKKLGDDVEMIVSGVDLEPFRTL